jgi:quercetin dioxygenase-like cupin family protein
MALNVHPYKVTLEGTPSDAGIPERGWIEMDVRWLVTRQSVGSENSVFGVTIFPPGSKHDIHRHPNAEEVEYLISGTGVAYVDDDAVELGPGEAVFVPKNAYHGFENTSDGEAVMAWLYGGAASLEEAGFVTRSEDELAAARRGGDRR